MTIFCVHLFPVAFWLIYLRSSFTSLLWYNQIWLVFLHLLVFAFCFFPEENYFVCCLPVSKNANLFLVCQLKMGTSHIRHLCIPVYWVLLSSCTQTSSVVRWSWAVSEQETILWNLQGILGILSHLLQGSIAWEDQQQCVDARNLHYWECPWVTTSLRLFCVKKEGHAGICKHCSKGRKVQILW